MSMTRLLEAPTWTKVRDVAGALTADPAVVNDTNYPPANAVDPDRAEVMSVYWEGVGAGRLDTIDLQVLMRDGINSQWVDGETKYGLPPRQVVTLKAHRTSMVYFRVQGINTVNAVTALEIHAVRQ